MAQKLFIGGLAFSTSTERLREFCSQVEGVESASVITDRATGQSRGFGFVEMASAEAAKAAVQQLNGRELDGRQLRVELANPPSSGAGRGSSGGGGGRGGNRW
jgi:RNA recognition motif-containing protein